MADLSCKAVKERVARSFAAVALVPMLLSAQEACPVREAWRMPRTIGGAVHAVVPRERELVLFGETVFTMRADASGAPVAVDTTLAGMRRDDDGAVALISRPRGVRAFIAPRAFRLASGAIEVVWSEPDFDAGAKYGDGAWFLRAATLNGSAWSEARTHARYFDHVALSRQVGSDVVRSGAKWRIAFTVDDTVRSQRPLVLATNDGGEWTIRQYPLSLPAMGSVALGDEQGTLVALMTAVVEPPNRPRGEMVRQSMWRTRLVDSAWTVPELVAGDGARPRSDPQLLTSPSGVIAAWLDRGDSTSALEWRDISSGREFGAIQRLDGVMMVVSGLEGHRDVLTVSMLDGTGRVLRLRADGFDEVGRFPARYGFSFPLAGMGAHPIAVVTDIETLDGRQWPTLTAYEIGCARPPSGGGTPPR